MYAIHSSFSEAPFVDLTRSVMEPLPQNSITSHSWSCLPVDDGSFLMNAP